MQDICKYIIVLYLLLFPFALPAQTRRALVIGIGQQEDKAWGKINGDLDVPYVEEILRNAKYKTKNIKNLLINKPRKHPL